MEAINQGSRPTLPKYITALCKNSISFFPAPYEYVIHQNKHIPEGVDALRSKAEKVMKFVLKHNGEFKILTPTPYIKEDMLCMRVFFNCATIYSKAMDFLIGGHGDNDR